MNLQEQLIATNKMRWLDVGCGDRFDEGFFYLDIISLDLIPDEVKAKYTEADITNLADEVIERLGKFDFIRLQHVFEHLSFEEGQKCLENCVKLMNQGSYILITVPDLKIHIEHYLKNDYSDLKGFRKHANIRIPEDAPASFYFSIFAHSLSDEAHRWCYDLEGLTWQLKKTKKFDDIRELKYNDPLAAKSFTHNRIKEDLGVIAKKKKPLLKFFYFWYF